MAASQDLEFRVTGVEVSLSSNLEPIPLSSDLWTRSKSVLRIDHCCSRSSSTEKGIRRSPQLDSVARRPPH
jgi:hypothetical protein